MKIEQVGVDAVLDMRAKVLFPGEPRGVARMKRDHDLTSVHWLLSDEGRALGCASVMLYRGWLLRGMAVDPAFQGRGLGLELLRRVEADMDRPMWCNARLAAAGFYARAGWRSCGPVFSLAGEPHQRMEFGERATNEVP